MCAKWRDSFEAFLADMGRCPDGLTLERKDPFGNYDRQNCIWDTWENQRKNKRTYTDSDIEWMVERAWDNHEREGQGNT